jgi:glycosyltransferase 2 family protein
MRILRVLLLVAGVAFLAILVAHNDPAEIFASMRRLAWRLAIVVCFPFSLITLFDTLGWRFAFRRDRVPFRTLVGARLAGEAFNLTTPTAALGGEAVKTWLLRGRAPFAENLSSVIIAKTTILIAQGIFLFVGVVVAWIAVASDSTVLHAMLWLLLVEVVAVGGFAAAQAAGLFSWGGVARDLASFYRQEPRRLSLSIAFHLVAWLLGVVEAYLMLQFLGVDVSLATATVIEAFATAIRFATFVIPSSVGVLEGGLAATFAALGLGSTIGISFGLVRRVREIAWVAVGFIAFAAMRVGEPQTAAISEGG